ncbi:hypothetical protein [Petrimonas mucosa]|uniref:hypothetical protein n=1 Tax=Petrimonas mucosa TaxID=1642646 RepID=UPI0008DB2646|nr:hypothetical protein [Petrimonas mucosa]
MVEGKSRNQDGQTTFSFSRTAFFSCSALRSMHRSSDWEPPDISEMGVSIIMHGHRVATNGDIHKIGFQLYISV